MPEMLAYGAYVVVEAESYSTEIVPPGIPAWVFLVAMPLGYGLIAVRAVEPEMVAYDFPVVAAFAVLAFPLLVRERRIGRRQGFLLLFAYAGYITWLIWSARR